MVKKNLLFAISLAALLCLPAWQAIIDLSEFGLASFEQLYQIILGLIFIAVIIIILIKLQNAKPSFLNWIVKAASFCVLIFLGLATLLYLKDRILSSIGVAQLFALMGISSMFTKFSIIVVFIFLIYYFRVLIFPFFRVIVELTAPLTFILTFVFINNLWSNLPTLQASHINKDHKDHDRQVVWIVMDELDQEKLKEMEGQLPNLYRMVYQGYEFKKAFPPANATQFSLPSYWLGEVPNSVGNDLNGVLLGLKSGEQPKMGWDKEKTIFRSRMDKGNSVYLRGWALDYCKTFSGKFYVKCNDHSNFTAPGRFISVWRWMVANHPLFNTLVQNTPADSKLGSVLAYLNGQIKGTFWFYQREIMREAVSDVLESINRGDEFIFWHANCPHTPSFNSEDFKWNKNMFDRDVSFNKNNLIYKNNLLVCDQSLGDIINALDSSQRNYMLVVVSDHWLRQKYNNSVTKIRPIPLILKFSEKEAKGGVAIEKKISTVHLHRFVNSYLDEGIVGILNNLRQIDDTWYTPPVMVYGEGFENKK